MWSVSDCHTKESFVGADVGERFETGKDKTLNWFLCVCSGVIEGA